MNCKKVSFIGCFLFWLCIQYNGDIMDYVDLIVQEGFILDKDYEYNGIVNLKLSLLNFSDKVYKKIKVFIILKGLIKIEDIDTLLTYSRKNNNVIIEVPIINSLEYSNILIKIKRIGFSQFDYKIIILDNCKKVIYKSLQNKKS